jgi:membrane protein DedA with SNARE-associated domain
VKGIGGVIQSGLSIILATATTARAVARGGMGALLVTALTNFTYVALLGVLIIAGLGAPIPEDIPLVLSGYMCNEEYSPIIKYVDSDNDGVMEMSGKKPPNVYLMMLTGMLGVLIGDSIVFTIGRRGIDGNNFVARHIRKVMNSSRREKVERHFAQHGNLTVFCGRFMPGFRSLVFAFAGMSKMSYGRFLMIDGFAAAISVPLFVYLGYHFAEHIEKVFFWIDRIKHILAPVLLVVIVGAIALYFVRRRRRPALDHA